MFTPVRMVAAAAVLALSTSLLFVSSLGPAEQSAPAGALSADDIAHVTGTAAYSHDTTACVLESTELYTDKTACGLEYEWVTDDPRFSGAGSSVITRRNFLAAGGIATIVGTNRVENDAGAWEGPMEAVVLPGTMDIRFLMTYEGSGAYEGLTAVIFGETDDQGAFIEVEGVIVPGEMPEIIVPGESPRDPPSFD